MGYKTNKIYKEMAEEKKKNKGGRPFGAVSEKTKTIREMISCYTDGRFNDFETAMDRVLLNDPDKYCKMYLELMSFRIPKLKSVDFTGDVKSSTLEDKLKSMYEKTMEDK